MRLLLVTQAVDRRDPTLGFFHEWIEEFARHCERVIVICLFEGEHSLLANVTVLSLGKETQVKAGGKNTPKVFSGIFPARLLYLYRFFKYIWKYHRQYDAVFVHMNQVYVLIGAPFWRIWNKRVVLWYAHGATSFSLRLAEHLADVIVTSTPEGFRLKSEKRHVVGQGINTKRFARLASGYHPDFIRILYAGRISPVKRCETLITAAGILNARGERFSVTFVGDTAADPAYYVSLKERVHALGITEQVTFVGGVPHDTLPQYLSAADIFVNPSATGSLDKAGLEALAAGVSLVTCNEAFTGVFGTYADRLMFPKGDARVLAKAILAVHRASDRQAITDTLAEKVRREHSLEGCILRIVAILSKKL